MKNQRVIIQNELTGEIACNVRRNVTQADWNEEIVTGRAVVKGAEYTVKYNRSDRKWYGSI